MYDSGEEVVWNRMIHIISKTPRYKKSAGLLYLGLAFMLLGYLGLVYEYTGYFNLGVGIAALSFLLSVYFRFLSRARGPIIKYLVFFCLLVLLLLMGGKHLIVYPMY